MSRQQPNINQLLEENLNLKRVFQQIYNLVTPLIGNSVAQTERNKQRGAANQTAANEQSDLNNNGDDVLQHSRLRTSTPPKPPKIVKRPLKKTGKMQSKQPVVGKKYQPTIMLNRIKESDIAKIKTTMVSKISKKHPNMLKKRASLPRKAAPIDLKELNAKDLFA